MNVLLENRPVVEALRRSIEKLRSEVHSIERQLEQEFDPLRIQELNLRKEKTLSNINRIKLEIANSRTQAAILNAEFEVQ